MTEHHTRRTAPVAAVMALLSLGACGGVERGAPATAGIVDSIFPIAEEVRRFEATVDSLPAALYHGAASRDELIARFVQAVETQDRVALQHLVLQRDEFIALYYPHTRYLERPYEIAPSLLWFQMENPSSRGLNRLLERMGGRALDFEGITCPDEPLIEKTNRIWEHCTVRIRGADGQHAQRRLFGAILEREGRWKFLSYANEL